ncbi:MAG: recombinase family protein [Fibrobacteria bacterium]
MAKPELIPTLKKAVIYARVSSKEQEREGFSIPAQLKSLREYAERKGFSVLAEYTDVETAKRSGRGQFTEMVRFFKGERRKKDNACRTLLVEKTDRLYRNFKDYVTLDELELDVHLVKENDVLSPDSKSHQKLLHGIKVVMAKNYIDNLSEEIEKGMKEKAEQGIFPSRAPSGYVNAHCGDKKFIQPDPELAPMIRRLFELYSTGSYSLLELTRLAHKEGLVTRGSKLKVPRGTVAKILNNPVYYGDFTWDRKLYHGTHEPLITRELFDRVQEILDRKATNRTGFRKHDWMFQGVLFCGHCGCAMVGDLKKGKYVYYHCTGYKGKCPEKYVREEEVSRQVEDALKALKAKPAMLDMMIRALKESHAEESRFHQEAVSGLQKERDLLESRLEALYLDKLDKVISPEFFAAKSQEWQAKLTDLRAKIDRHGHAHMTYINEGIELLELSQRAVERYNECERAEKKRILNLLLSNSLWMNAALIPKYRQPFDLLAVMNVEDQKKIAPSVAGEGDLDKWWSLGESNS